MQWPPEDGIDGAVMTLKFANFGTALLAAPITATDTALTITSGSEVNFPTMAAGEWFPLVVIDASARREVMRCTGRVTNVLTVVRGQESTPARTYPAGSRVDARLTAAALAAFWQKAAPLVTAEAVTLTGSSAKGRII